MTRGGPLETAIPPSQMAIIRRLRTHEKETLAQHAALIEELKTIPHLPLPIPIDLAVLVQEAKQVQEFASHELHQNKQLPEWYYRHHRESFRGQCLVDYTESGKTGMIDSEGYLFEEPDAIFEINKDSERLRFFETPWGKSFPKTLNTLRQLSPYLNRTRVISTPPGGGIHWHSHHNNVYLNAYLRLAVVILTLESNEQCRHGVRDYRDPESAPVYQHYDPGQAILFNSWHDHDFWNRGSTPRLTIISYFNFPDEDFLKTLEIAVNQYAGPRLNKG